MRIFTQEEWARHPYKGRCPANQDHGDMHPGMFGRRTVTTDMGTGVCTMTEGIDFLVEGDYSFLPFLVKDNAMEGACYQFPGGYIQVTRVYRLTMEEALEHDLYFMDRVEFIQHAEWGSTTGGCGLVGGEMRKGPRTNGGSRP